MNGCFGSHPVDRYLEQQLMRHLAEESTFRCSNIECAFESQDEEAFDFDDETNELICPHCKNRMKI